MGIVPLFLITFSLSLLIFSMGFVFASETDGSLGVDTGGGNVVIKPEACEEDWSGSTWSQCDENNEQIFICFDKNNCGTEELKPAQCGETRTCQEASSPEVVETSSGGGGGGGSGGGGGGGGGGFISPKPTIEEASSESDGSSCVENWKCEAWSNEESSCGQRTCVDLNECGTDDLKPSIRKSCGNIFSSFFSYLTGSAVDGVSDSSKIRNSRIIAVVAIVAIGAGLFFMQKRKTRIRMHGH